MPIVPTTVVRSVLSDPLQWAADARYLVRPLQSGPNAPAPTFINRVMGWLQFGRLHTSDLADAEDRNRWLSGQLGVMVSAGVRGIILNCPFGRPAGPVPFQTPYLVPPNSDLIHLTDAVISRCHDLRLRVWLYTGSVVTGGMDGKPLPEREWVEPHEPIFQEAIAWWHSRGVTGFIFDTSARTELPGAVAAKWRINQTFPPGFFRRNLLDIRDMLAEIGALTICEALLRGEAPSGFEEGPLSTDRTLWQFCTSRFLRAHRRTIRPGSRPNMMVKMDAADLNDREFVDLVEGFDAIWCCSASALLASEESPEEGDGGE